MVQTTVLCKSSILIVFNSSVAILQTRNVKQVLENLLSLLNLKTLSFKFPADVPQTSLLNKDWLRMNQSYLEHVNAVFFKLRNRCVL